MSITTETNRTTELTTDGVETDFDFSMLIHADTEVQVWYKVTDGEYIQLALNTDYGVVFTEDGGTVSTDGYRAPLAAGELLIIRHLELTQQTNWLYNDNHTGQQHQDDFDRAAMRDIQIQEQLDRVIMLAIHSGTTGIILPEPEANYFLGWNAGGTNLANISPSAIAVLVSEELELGTVPDELTDLSDVTIGAPVAGHILRYDGAAWVNYADSNYQPADAGLTDIAALAVTDGNFIVGDGANFVAESADTARTSLGLGTGDSPTFAGLTLGGLTLSDDLVFSANRKGIRANTVDGSDTHVVTMAGGGAAAKNRGGFIYCYGNEDPGNAGQVHIIGGDVAGGGIALIAGDVADNDITFTVEGSERGRFKAEGLDLGGHSILGTSVDISNAELQQLSNIGAATISDTQWGYLGALDQGLATGNSPTFVNVTADLTLATGGATFTDDVSANITIGGTSLALDMGTGILTLLSGSITDSTGAISFGDENLSTSGYFRSTGTRYIELQGGAIPALISDYAIYVKPYGNFVGWFSSTGFNLYTNKGIQFGQSGTQHALLRSTLDTQTDGAGTNIWCLMWGLHNLDLNGTKAGRYLLFSEDSDIGFDFEHGIQTNPTIFIHSANQATDEWISLTHDQTDAVIDTGKGFIKLNKDTTVSGTLDVSGTLSIAQYLRHIGNIGTQITFGQGVIQFFADQDPPSGSIKMLELHNSGISSPPFFFTINPDGQDVDTRIESFHNSNLVFIDGSTDTIYLGNNGPTNYTKFATNGLQTMAGEARTINHVILEAHVFKLPAANFPAENLEGLFPTLDYAHNQVESAYVSGFIPFRWDSDTDVVIEIVWIADGDCSGADVVWGIDYAGRKDNEAVGGAVTNFTEAFTGRTAGLERRNIFTVKLLKGNLEADDDLGIRVYRDTDDVADTYGAIARFIALHLHFVRNSIGGPLS